MEAISHEFTDTLFRGGPLDGQVRPVITGAEMYTYYGGAAYIDGWSIRKTHVYQRARYVCRTDGERVILQGQIFDHVAEGP